MATRKCPFCKEKVREDAMLCKHCKSKLPPLPPKKWYQTWWGLLLVLFGLMIIANVFGLKTNPKPETPPSPEELARKQYFSDDIDARVYAKIYVEKRLKSPSNNTARFAVCTFPAPILISSSERTVSSPYRVFATNLIFILLTPIH